MPRHLVGTIFRVLLLSLIVGLILSTLDISPLAILEGLGVTARGAVDAGASLVAWVVEYVLVGAVVVVPIWVVLAVIGRVRRGG